MKYSLNKHFIVDSTFCKDCVHYLFCLDRTIVLDPYDLACASFKYKHKEIYIMPKAILIDFDGVVHKYSKGWQDGEIYDEPVKGTKEALTYFKDILGFTIVIFTTRVFNDSSKEAHIRLWLNKFKIPFDRITAIKEPAVLQIDDRGYRFDGNWPSQMKTILSIIDKSRPSSYKPDVTD